MTNYYNWTNEINNNELNECINILKNDGLVVIPTETVYGISANALSKEAVSKIFVAKGRHSDNPIIVHVSDKKMLLKVAKQISEIEMKLIDNFMPGPFTLILNKSEIVPDIVTAGLPTVAVRMPSNKIMHEVIKTLNLPIAAPSANISGRPSGTRIQDIKEELSERVDAIIDGGDSDIGLESTVVKVIDGIPTILRPGKITLEDIEKVTPARISQNILQPIKQEEKVESPGMKYRHYAPKTECVLVCAKTEQEQIEKVNKLLEKYPNNCVLGFKEHETKIHTKLYINIGSIKKLEEISKNIFKSLRKADSKNVDLIIIEGVSEKGIGLAIMNRLFRACEFNVI